MFTVLELGRLSKEASRKAVTVPLQKTKKWSFTELAINEIIAASDGYPYFITPGDVSQMLPRLIEKGLVYKNRLGKYCFAVPLFSGFIKRRKPPAEKSQKRLF
jgi:hypothetical protein